MSVWSFCLAFFFFFPFVLFVCFFVFITGGGNLWWVSFTTTWNFNKMWSEKLDDLWGEAYVHERTVVCERMAFCLGFHSCYKSWFLKKGAVILSLITRISFMCTHMHKHTRTHVHTHTHMICTHTHTHMHPSTLSHTHTHCFLLCNPIPSIFHTSSLHPGLNAHFHNVSALPFSVASLPPTPVVPSPSVSTPSSLDPASGKSHKSKKKKKKNKHKHKHKHKHDRGDREREGDRPEKREKSREPDPSKEGGEGKKVKKEGEGESRDAGARTGGAAGLWGIDLFSSGGSNNNSPTHRSALDEPSSSEFEVVWREWARERRKRVCVSGRLIKNIGCCH